MAAKTQTKPVTTAKLKAIYTLARIVMGLDRQAVEQQSWVLFGCAPDALTTEQACQFIDARFGIEQVAA